MDIERKEKQYFSIDRIAEKLNAIKTHDFKHVVNLLNSLHEMRSEGLSGSDVYCGKRKLKSKM